MSLRHNIGPSSPLASQTRPVTGRATQRCWRVLAWGVALVVWLAVLSATASAEVTREPVSSFAGAGAPDGPYNCSGSSCPVGDAVDNSGDASAGDVWVEDLNFNTGTGTVDKFNPDGSYAGVEITGSTTPATSIGLLSGAGVESQVAVDDSASANTGDVYVADPVNGVLDKFDEAGDYVCQISGRGSASATTVSPSECDSATAGVPGGSFQPLGVAVSASGDVYVSDANSNAIDEFGPNGAYIGQISDPNLTSPGAIAIDSTGNLYVVNGSLPSPGNVVKFDSLGAFAGTIESGQNAVSVAVDPTNQDVLVGQIGGGIEEFNSSGALRTTVSPGPTNLYLGEAVSAATGDSYAPDTGASQVQVFGPVVVLPNVTTNPATSVGDTTATLNGSVDPDSADGGTAVTSCEFEYGTGTSYGSMIACSPSTPYTSPMTVSATPTLSPDTTYHFRLDANNANGIVNPGQDQTVTTSGPPVIDGQTPTAGTTSATLDAGINPFGHDTSCQVQYVDQADFQSSGYANATSLPCSPADLGSGFGDQDATAQISGLQLASTYHFRLIASNSSGTTTGADQTFATFGIKDFSITETDQNGAPYTQAGGHPYELTTSFDFNTTHGGYSTDANVRDAYTELPPGLIGNPQATPRCTRAQLENADCPGSTQVGLFVVRDAGSGGGPDGQPNPLYNMVPPAGVPAEFGTLIIQGTPVYIDASVRTGGDYGVTAAVISANREAGVTGAMVTFWGVPADPSHDAQRGCPNPGGLEEGPCQSTSPLVPFLTNPTSCTGPMTATLRTDSWQDPGAFASATSTLPAVTGCDRLDFTPAITVQPDTTMADSPSGLDVDLSMPQDGLSNPNGLAEADLKKAVVTLPQGVSVDPSSADGLQACTPAQIGIDNANAPSCPNASQIGTVQIDTPLLPDPLTGGVYLAQQTNNPFGSLLALYITAQADGTLVKLAGHVVPDPVTGQLTTTFDNNPQLPFSDFKLDFKGGPRGVLATPEDCGTFTTTTDMSPWSGGADATPSDSFATNSGCVSGFTPSFTAGTQNAQAGAYSPFVLSLSRSDTDENFQGLSVKLPPGMLAKLAGVGECSEQQLASISNQLGTGSGQIANPSCPANSQVGTVTTGAGTGPDPFFLGGKAYLTGPYKGAPYGLAVVVPAVAGPLDLGTVVVRQALYVDPTTAQVTDVSDPFPTILDGIPLRIRRIDVNLNRPDFTINPTSCDPMSIDAIASSTQGTITGLSSYFQVGGCAALAFNPKLKMSLTGKGKTRSGDHPALVSTLTQPFGQANIHDVKVTLPLSMALDPNNSQHVCDYDAALAVHGGAVPCPASTIVGSATAITPLLSQPLTGNVYLVQGIRFNSQGQRIRTLPTLLIPLRGQIALDLRAKTSVNSASQLVTTFSTIPDAAVSKFTLTITGGKKGLLVITGRGRTICNKSQITTASLGAQSGKTENSTITMTTPCRAVSKHPATSHRHRKARKK